MRDSHPFLGPPDPPEADKPLPASSRRAGTSQDKSSRNNPFDTPSSSRDYGAQVSDCSLWIAECQGRVQFSISHLRLLIIPIADFGMSRRAGTDSNGADLRAIGVIRGSDSACSGSPACLLARWAALR